MWHCRRQRAFRDHLVDVVAAALSLHREESPLASGGLRIGQSLPTSQTADSAVGSAGGVVSPGAGKRPTKTQNVDAQSTLPLEIAVGMRNRSRKTASNLQYGKYQDPIRSSLTDSNHRSSGEASAGVVYSTHKEIGQCEPHQPKQI